MSEYLDREEVEEIFKDMLIMIMGNFCDENIGDPADMAINIWEENEKDFNIFINKICQLQPKNQVVIGRGKVKINEYGYMNFGAFKLDKYKNKKVKIILEEE